jgi:probable HAF family extracellular repeat protein
MSALPTLGGNNGQASAINNRGQIAGMAEDGTLDSSCPAGTTNNRLQLPVLWENGRAHALPTPVGDASGFAQWINDHGQAVGYTGNCGAMSHAVSWENGTVTKLEDLGTGAGAIAYGNNNRGQIVGSVFVTPGGAIRYAALWQNGELTQLKLLPGDIAAIATGINDQGQVVGSSWDSNFNWSNAFIYQDGVITNLNMLFPKSSNLHATMANKINNLGQISGMATVMRGPDEGKVHAFLATPVNQSER